MPAQKKLGNEECPKCHKLGRAKFVPAWNAKVKYHLSENKYVQFIHNDRNKRNCYIGSHKKYLENQVKDHPYKEVILRHHARAKDMKYIVSLLQKFANKYVNPNRWPLLTKEEDDKLAYGLRYEGKIFSDLGELIRLQTESELLWMMQHRLESYNQTASRNDEYEDKFKPIFESIKHTIISIMESMKQDAIRVQADMIENMAISPFWPELNKIMEKYEFPKRREKIERLNEKLSDRHFGSEKYPNHDFS